MSPRESAEQHLLGMLGPRLRTYFPPEAIDHAGIWVDGTFRRLRQAIGNGDKIAISIACDLIEQDPHLPFGKLIKSGLSRELKKQIETLLPSERGQVIATTVKLLSLEFAPRELEDYARLVAKFPRDEYVTRIAGIETKNEKALRLKQYMLGQADG